jgi:hypothetical protein
MEELEGEKRSLEARRERLELPAIDKEMLRSLVNNFERVMAEGPNPKKKHLLHQLVKKVLIHSRDTIESATTTSLWQLTASRPWRIAVESKGVFKNDPVANVTRRTPVERIVSAISLSGGTRSHPRSQNPRGLPNF